MNKPAPPSRPASRSRTCRKKQLKPAAQLVLMVLVLLLIGVPVGWLLSRHSTSSFAEGVDYLYNQETREFDTVYEEVIQSMKALDPEVVENPDTRFSAFYNSVIMGDSRAAGFKEFNFLPSNLVLAEVSAPISAISLYVDTIADMQPNYIYMTYGLNNLDPGKENGYTQDTIDLYESCVQELQEVSPESTIVICAVLPVTDAAKLNNRAYAFLDDFNADLKAMAERNGWLYDSGSSLSLEDYEDLYSPDGEHFDSAYYPEWAKSMLNTVLVNQSLTSRSSSSNSTDASTTDSSSDSSTDDTAADSSSDSSSDQTEDASADTDSASGEAAGQEDQDDTDQ